jgi:hypothetical protein
MLRVFLSYHTPDRTIALNLKRAIEDALPGADVFVDQTHLRYGHLWQPSLFDAIGPLVSIGKHLGMFVDRLRIQERKQISAEPMSAEEWKRQFVREG